MDGKEIKKEHIEALEVSAIHAITDRMQAGVVMGEMNDSLLTDDNPRKEIDYHGWWSQKDVDFP